MRNSCERCCASYSSRGRSASRWWSRWPGSGASAQQVLVRPELLVGHDARRRPHHRRAANRLQRLAEAGRERRRAAARGRQPDHRARRRVALHLPHPLGHVAAGAGRQQRPDMRVGALDQRAAERHGERGLEGTGPVGRVGARRACPQHHARLRRGRSAAAAPAPRPPPAPRRPRGRRRSPSSGCARTAARAAGSSSPRPRSARRRSSPDRGARCGTGAPRGRARSSARAARRRRPAARAAAALPSRRRRRPCRTATRRARRAPWCGRPRARCRRRAGRSRAARSSPAMPRAAAGARRPASSR